MESSRERYAVRLVAGFHVQALKSFLNLAQIVIPGCLSTDKPKISDERERKEFTKEVMET